LTSTSIGPGGLARGGEQPLHVLQPRDVGRDGQRLHAPGAALGGRRLHVRRGASGERQREAGPGQVAGDGPPDPLAGPRHDRGAIAEAEHALGVKQPPEVKVAVGRPAPELLELGLAGSTQPHVSSFTKNVTAAIPEVTLREARRGSTG